MLEGALSTVTLQGQVLCGSPQDQPCLLPGFPVQPLLGETVSGVGNPFPAAWKAGSCEMSGRMRGVHQRLLERELKVNFTLEWRLLWSTFAYGRAGSCIINPTQHHHYPPSHPIRVQVHFCTETRALRFKCIISTVSIPLTQHTQHSTTFIKFRYNQRGILQLLDFF